MKKVMLILLVTFILCAGMVHASGIDNQPNFKIAKKQPITDYYDLVTFQEDGKKGLKDENGNVIVKPEWDEIHIYVDISDETGQQQFIPVKRNGAYGVIDRKGNIICEPVWKEVNPCRESVTVRDFNDKYGFVDTDGRVIVEPKYDYATYFSNGIAEVGRDFGYTYIDKSGNEIMALQPVRLSVSDDNKLFCYQLNDRCYLLDKSGNMLSDGKYDEMYIHLQDAIIVKLDGKYGVINGKNEIIIPFEYEDINIKYDPSKPVDYIFKVKKDGKAGYIDMNGKIIGNIEWDIDFYSDNTRYKNLLLIKKDDKYGFMDKRGNVVIEPIFSDISENIVELNGLVGILNDDGSYLVEPKWTVSINDVRLQNNGCYIIWVKQSEKEFDYKMALLDPNGHVIIEPLFDDLMYFRGKFLACNSPENKDTDYLLLDIADNPTPLSDDFLRQPQHTTEINELVEKGILKGDEKGDLTLYDSVTRSEFVTMVLRANGSKADAGDNAIVENVFSDIDNHWAKNGIIKAAKEGLLSGFEDGTFKPDDYITNDQTLRILLRALGLSDETISEYDKYSPTHDCRSLADQAKIVPDNLRKINNAASRMNIAIMIYKYIHTDMTKKALEELPPMKSMDFFG